MNYKQVKLSLHFKLGEMIVTKTGLENVPNVEQVNNLRLLCREILEPLRSVYNKPLIIDSAFRSPDVNTAVGGVSTSQHLLGQAADIHSDYIPARVLYNDIRLMVDNGHFHIGQCIYYPTKNFVHVSLPSPRHKDEFFINHKY